LAQARRARPPHARALLPPWVRQMRDRRLPAPCFRSRSSIRPSWGRACLASGALLTLVILVYAGAAAVPGATSIVSSAPSFSSLRSSPRGLLVETHAPSPPHGNPDGKPHHPDAGGSGGDSVTGVSVVDGASVQTAKFMDWASIMALRIERKIKPYLPNWSMGTWFAAGYGSALVLLVLYFIWEDGPCHQSQRREGQYLSFALVLVYVTSMLLSSNGHMLGIRLGANQQVRQLMRLLLLIFILEQFTVPEPRAPFFDSTPARRHAMSQVPAPSAHARRVVIEVNHKVIVILQQFAVRHFMGLSGKTLGPIMFLLSMLDEADWVWPNLRAWVTVLCVSLEIFTIVYMASSSVIRGWALKRETGKLHVIVKDMVDRRQVDVLAYVLANVNVAALFEIARADTGAEFACRALKDGLLSTLGKAIIIDALMKKGKRLSPDRQHEVEALLLSCTGDDVTTLKNLIDGSGNYHNLYKLIYSDIKLPYIRTAILTHFATQAREVRATAGGAVGVKVLSDVDDTLSSSGGKFPAGCDTGFPRHMVYPGVLELFKALDRGWTPEAVSCNLVFLSARPHVYKDATEDKSYQLFCRLVEERRMHSFPTLLPGQLWQGFHAMSLFACFRTKSWRPVGDLKFRTFQNFRELYSEYDFVFCGDNGQGDLWAGQLMMKEQRERSTSNEGDEPETALTASDASGAPGPSLLGCIIHEVLPDNKVLAREPAKERGAAWREGLKEQRIVLHKSYVGAAVALHQFDPPLVSARQLADIANSAAEEFENTRLMYHDWGQPAHRSSRAACGDAWTSAEMDLRADLQTAGIVVQAAGLPQLNRLQTIEELLAEG